jgi:3-deoxy-D-manno-octulosonic-acid transferase
MTDAGGLLLKVYVGLTRLAAPVGRLVLAWRRLSGREDPARWRERLGRSAGVRPEGPLVWVHAVSVGETVAALPLIDRLGREGVTVLVTSVTTTSAAILEHRNGGERFIHQFAPLDLASCIDRFLDQWRPDLAILVESEVWPVTIARLGDHGVPLMVVNGRLSPRSGRRWGNVPFIARAIFGRLPLVLAQSEGDAARFLALGAPSVRSVGNIKFDAAVPEASATTSEALAAAIAGRPMLLAASTHPGEDEIVLAAFRLLRESHPDALLTILPRHPVRGLAIAALAAAAGFSVSRREPDGALPTAATDVYVADTLGEAGTFFRAATVAVIGGTLIDGIGGHNPIEPARLGTAALSGPYFANWLDVYAAFLDADGLGVVRTPEELAAAATALLADPERRAARAEAAAAVVDRLGGALDETLAAARAMLGDGAEAPR